MHIMHPEIKKGGMINCSNETGSEYSAFLFGLFAKLTEVRIFAMCFS